jgi:threonine dehydrogenase-like Zn-dependent dehydrogenase
MRGLVFPGDRQARIENFDDPKADFGEVVVAIKAAAICGSDMHSYRTPAAERVAKGAAGTIPGHEPSGVVCAVGEGVTNVKIGDRVAVYHFRSCGHCEECRSGRMMWCDDRRGYGGPIHGSDADFLLTDARNCLPLPDDASFALGAIMMCVGGTAYEAMQKLDARADKRIAIFGLGPVGLAGMLFAKAMGAEVIGIDMAPHRLELAKSLGADAVVNTKDEDVKEAVKRWSGKDGVSGSFETSGAAAAQSATVAVTGRGGKIAFVGFGSGAPSVTPAEFIVKQLNLMGSFVFPIDHYFRILDFVRDRKIPLEATITHSVPLADAAEILPAFDRGETGKVILVP